MEYCALNYVLHLDSYSLPSLCQVNSFHDVISYCRYSRVHEVCQMAFLDYFGDITCSVLCAVLLQLASQKIPDQLHYSVHFHDSDFLHACSYLRFLVSWDCLHCSCAYFCRILWTNLLYIFRKFDSTIYFQSN